MSKYKAGYQCQLRGCMKLFTLDKPAMVVCPQCGHKYVKWVNYEIMYPPKRR